MARLAILLTSATLAAFMAPAAAAPPRDCPRSLLEKPPTGPDTPAARAAAQELEMVVNVVVGYEGCAEVAGFPAKYGPIYDEFRRRYRGPVERYERNAHARRYVQCGVDEERRRMASESEAGKEQKRELCNTVIGPGIGALVARTLKQ